MPAKHASCEPVHEPGSPNPALAPPHADRRGPRCPARPAVRPAARGRTGGPATRFREPVDPGLRRAGLVPRLRGMVAGHLAAHRDLRRPGGADVDPAGPRGAGGHAGPALLRPIRPRPGNGRLRARVLGLGRPAEPPHRRDARLRHPGPRAAGGRHGHGRRDRRHRPGRRRPGRRRRGDARLAPLGVARGAGPASGSGVPGRTRPADAQAGGRNRRRRAAQLGDARAHRRQPGADRPGRRPGRPRTR